MPAFEEIVRYLNGAWRMMTGRRDGMQMLDLSADGFWNSFYAIVVALPPMFASWVAFANILATQTEAGPPKFEVIILLGMVDIAGWILPLLLFALAVRPAGIADRFVVYVVASNWGAALTAWLALPASLMRLFIPDSPEAASGTGLVIFLITLALFWRLTNVAIDKGPAMGTAVFAAMVAASITIVVTLQGLLGLVPA